MPSHRYRVAVSHRPRVTLASPLHLVPQASRLAKASHCRRVAYALRSFRVGVALASPRHRATAGFASPLCWRRRWKPSRRLSRRVGVKSFFACRHVGIASLSCTDLAKASLRHHRNVVIASPSCRRRIAAVKPSRCRPVPLRRRRVDHESRRRRLAVASVSRLFCVP